MERRYGLGSKDSDSDADDEISICCVVHVTRYSYIIVYSGKSLETLYTSQGEMSAVYRVFTCGLHAVPCKNTLLLIALFIYKYSVECEYFSLVL